ncbi:MAG: glycosyltransferase [Candidatus Absconditabacterales bacterium]|nr:glycosyltransferase [Candidatus Absconditabacterales bacterium]
MKKRNIAMAGGGTGGHVFPIKSLIEHIDKNPEYSQKISKIIRFGQKNSLEKELFDKLKGKYPYLYFQNIVSGKYRRETWFSSRLKNIRDIFKFIFGVFQSIFYLIKHRIDIVFCKGGYVALPVVFAARLLRKKIVVHESDVRSGLVNKIAARYADRVFTGFDGVLAKSTRVGQILSDEIIAKQSIKNPPKARDLSQKNIELTVHEQLFYSNPSKTHLLVIGGSQGSKRLYEDLQNTIISNPEVFKNYEIFVVLGKENTHLKEIFEKIKNVHSFDFITQSEMGLLLKHCDISLTRAGTTSLAEQKLYNLKIVMVPIPWTHDQYDNAKYYVDNYDDILLDSKDPNYKDNMLEIFNNYKNFKKEEIVLDISSEISSAKDTIISELLA